MLDLYVKKVDEMVAHLHGNSVEATRFNKVGMMTNLILIDVLEELKAIKEVLAVKPVEEKAEEDKPVVKKAEEDKPIVKKAPVKSATK